MGEDLGGSDLWLAFGGGSIDADGGQVLGLLADDFETAALSRWIAVEGESHRTNLMNRTTDSSTDRETTRP